MTNTISHNYKVTRAEREKLNGHKSLCIWFTGLSGSGKSTIADALSLALHEKGIRTFSLDGDNIRNGINKGLGFTGKERSENIRRTAHIAKLLVDSGAIVLSAFITPLHKDRALSREIIGKDDYIEIYVNTTLQECEKRDVKGLYEKARAGEIKNFTGLDSPYESPINPDIKLNTENTTVIAAVNKIINHIQDRL